ncbi:hypothetical protein pb186bvf_016991 [Paramecium bursaria]
MFLLLCQFINQIKVVKQYRQESQIFKITFNKHPLKPSKHFMKANLPVRIRNFNNLHILLSKQIPVKKILLILKIEFIILYQSEFIDTYLKFDVPKILMRQIYQIHDNYQIKKTKQKQQLRDKEFLQIMEIYSVIVSSTIIIKTPSQYNWKYFSLWLKEPRFKSW